MSQKIGESLWTSAQGGHCKSNAVNPLLTLSAPAVISIKFLPEMLMLNQSEAIRNENTVISQGDIP